MNKKQLVGIAVIILVIGVLALAVLNSNTNNNEIKIGLIAPLSGGLSYFGEQQVKGAQMAVDEINAQGGINGQKLRLLVEDDKTSVADGISAVNKLIFVDQTKWIIGSPFNAVCLAVNPMTNDNNVLHMSPGCSLDELSQDDLFFRTIPSTQEMMKRLADFAYNDLNIQTAAILKRKLNYDEEHAKDFRQFFEQLGGKIVSEESVLPTQRDFKTELTKINEKDPELVLDFFSAGALIGEPIKQAKELGMSNEWMTSWGGENNGLITEYGDVADGLFFAYPYDSTQKTAAGERFTTRFKGKYNGETPDYMATASYDAVMLLANAFRTNTQNVHKIKQHLLGITHFEGASGIFSFDANGDVQKKIIIKKIHNGAFVKVAD